VFLTIGSFGLLQLLLGLLHLPAPLVQQWLIPGVWPRINGFSYEPSYFSSYMLMGWVFASWLMEKRNYVLGRRLTQATFAVSTLVMLLSTSRLGWAMMVVWGVGYAVRRFRSTGPWRFSPSLLIGSLCFLMAITLWVARSPDKIERDLAFFAAGTGVYGTAAHSVRDRERSFGNTLAVFEKSPFVGYSLGGVATAIGVMQGKLVSGNADAKHNEGGSVFIEVLAASGVIGIVPFLFYLGVLITKPLIVSRRVGGETGGVLSGLVWALCMELLILQFNQNILRAYLWFQIGVLSAAYAAIAKDNWRASAVPNRARSRAGNGESALPALLPAGSAHPARME
jgi:hypothetical protein